MVFAGAFIISQPQEGHDRPPIPGRLLAVILCPQNGRGRQMQQALQEHADAQNSDGDEPGGYGYGGGQNNAVW